MLVGAFFVAVWAVSFQAWGGTEFNSVPLFLYVAVSPS